MLRATAQCFGPAPGALGRGQKVKYHLISFTESISKIFLYQPLCVFSQIKYIKHIKRDFHSISWVMPQGWDFGALGYPMAPFFFEHGHVAYQIDGDDEQHKMQVKLSP